jgi:hypothetical protein
LHHKKSLRFRDAGASENIAVSGGSAIYAVSAESAVNAVNAVNAVKSAVDAVNA